MEPITITILIASSILAVSFWPWIASLFSTKIIPWVRERISPTIAEMLVDILAFVDNPIVQLRRSLKTLWKCLKENLLGCKTEYTKISATTAMGTTTTLVRDANGKLMQTTITEEIDWADLPESVRAEMIRQKVKTAESNTKEAIENKFKETAQKQGVTLEMSH